MGGILEENEMSRSLKVVYDGPPDFEMDEKIEEAVKPYGWRMWARGTDLIDNVRDLSFDLREGEEG